MSWMILGHLFDWWLKAEQSWIRIIMTMILEPVGASGFLFISGISIVISYKKRLDKARISDELNYRTIRNSYHFRALFILIIAICYNSTVAISLMNPSMVWTWFILLTIAISLILVWPLLKTTKLFRIFFGIAVIIINQILITLLLPYEGNSNLFGFLFLLLYNGIKQDPILTFFPFFLFGTVLGESIYDSLSKKNEIDSDQTFNRKFLLPSISCGVFFVSFGILFKFPKFLTRATFSWIIYSIGFDLILISLFLLLESIKIMRSKKSYRLLFYYSYYSLTIYLAHNLLYFLFLDQLNVYNIWFFIGTTFFIIGFILRAIYKKWGSLASIKAQVGRISLILANKIEKRLILKRVKDVKIT